MPGNCENCPGTTAYGFIIVGVFFIIWAVLSLGSIGIFGAAVGLPLFLPLGILGDMMFRYLLNIPLFQFSFPHWWPFQGWWGIFPKWIVNIIPFCFIPYIVFFVISNIAYLIDIVPIGGPAVNFLRFWQQKYFQ